jgi:hypothetical protein
MAEIRFDFDIEGALQEDPYLDRFQLDYLFEQTRRSMASDLERKLAGIRCEEHDREPVITITGRYDGEQEEMDIQYHIDTCCQMFMVRVVRTINNVN